MTDSLPFQAKRFADYGSSHPVVARLCLQVFDLARVSGLPADVDAKLGEYLIIAADEMIKAERAKKAFGEKCERFVTDIREGRGINVQPSALIVNEPLGLDADLKEFLIHLVISLRLVIKAAHAILTSSVKSADDGKGPKAWRALKKTIEGGFPTGHPLKGIITKHEGWTGNLWKMRGEIEHEPVLFKSFQVRVTLGRALEVVPPMTLDGSPAKETMEDFYRNGFAFAEDLLVYALASRLPSTFLLQEIPEERRDPGNPKRFALGVVPGALGPS